MGSSNSRLGSRPRAKPGLKRRLSSLLICGGAAGEGEGEGSTSNNAPTINDMDSFPDELLAHSYEGNDPLVINRLQSSMNGHSPISCSETECSHSTIDASSDNSDDTIAPLFTEYCAGPDEKSSDKKCLSKRKDLVPDMLDFDHNSVVPYFERTSEIGSTSFIEQQSPPFVSVRDDLNAAVEVDSKSESGSPISQEAICSSISPHQEDIYLHGTEVSPPNPADSSLDVQASGSEFVARTNDSSLSPQLRIQTAQEEAPPGSGLFMLDRERERSDRGVLHVDVVSISSSSLFSSSGEGSSHEARRNSRRLFWDAFSRRSSRRHSDSRTIFFSSEDTDDLGPHDRWLLDYNGHLFDDGLGSESGLLGSRSRSRHEGRWHSRSEIWERFRGGLDESSQHNTFCASGLHPDGTCSCESFLTADESSTRGSISHIVMLAEALFEVLDEIHRQPMSSLSLSMVAVPAPESVVNSFPLKSHKKPKVAESTDQDVEQCYICLAEYEDGDKIRVLPCCHEYHMSCVDKWLKEIHGVCPLCRGDVCAGVAEGSISSS